MIVHLTIREAPDLNKIRLGRSGLMVTGTAMGCLPIQRCSDEDAVAILRRAYEGGINYYDTANAYTDSEHKIGLALSDVRENIIISTKSLGKNASAVLGHIENSLRQLRTDYIDLFQFHCVGEMPDFDDPDGIYAGALEAQRGGWVRHIGVTAHKIDLAFELVRTGRFETMQFPFSYISGEKELRLIELCRELDVGFIAMKGLSGGLITNARAAYAFMRQYDNVVPIWGVQTLAQIDEFLALAEEDPPLDDELRAVIEADRKELCGSFCRGCGYCLPCPADIEIFTSARMNMLLRRSPWQQYMTDAWYEKMQRINDCQHCGHCAANCPYGLDTPALLQYMLQDYNQFYQEHIGLLKG